MSYQAWFWLAVIILFLVIEMITVSLVSIWFVGGALAAFLAAYFTDTMWIQVVAFLAVSVVLLVLLIYQFITADLQSFIYFQF